MVLFINITYLNIMQQQSFRSGCGSVGRAVASDTKGLWFNPVVGKIYIKHLFTVNCREKVKRKKKMPGMTHLEEAQIYRLVCNINLLHHDRYIYW